MVLVLTLVTFLSEIISGAMWVKLAIVLLQGTGPSAAFNATSKSITYWTSHYTVSTQITNHSTVQMLNSVQPQGGWPTPGFAVNCIAVNCPAVNCKCMTLLPIAV